MSDKHQVIIFDWPNSQPWKALQLHIEKRIKSGELKEVEGPAQVSATFSMTQAESMWHMDEPGLDRLARNLLTTLEESGIAYALDIVQLNIGKVVPGPNAPRPQPGVRISILSLDKEK